jgi:hypothetical protein
MAFELLIYYRSDYLESYKIGDIVEVQDSGYWTIDHDFNRNAFKVAVVDKDVKDKKLEDLIYDSDGNIVHKRKNLVQTVLTSDITYFDKLQDLDLKIKTTAAKSIKAKKG